MNRLLTVPCKALVCGALVVATTGVVSVVSAQPAGACSCAASTDDQAIKDADAAFTGTLIDVIGPTGEAASSADGERFVFEVRDVFKGDVMGTQSVVTPWDGSSCGLEIAGPGPYLVFAYNDSQLISGARRGELYSHLCSGTRALADRELSIDVTPTPPVEAESDLAAYDGTMEPAAPAEDASVTVVVAAGVLAAIGGCWLWRSMRKS